MSQPEKYQIKEIHETVDENMSDSTARSSLRSKDEYEEWAGKIKEEAIKVFKQTQALLNAETLATQAAIKAVEGDSPKDSFDLTNAALNFRALRIEEVRTLRLLGGNPTSKYRGSESDADQLVDNYCNLDYYPSLHIPEED